MIEFASRRVRGTRQGAISFLLILLALIVHGCSPGGPGRVTSGLSSGEQSIATVIGEAGEDSAVREKALPPDDIKMLPVSVNPARIGSTEVEKVIVRLKAVVPPTRAAIQGGLKLHICAPEKAFEDATVSQCRVVGFEAAQVEGAQSNILRYEAPVSAFSPAITLKELYHFKFAFETAAPAVANKFIANLEVNAIPKGANPDAPQVRLFFDGSAGIDLLPQGNTYAVLTSRAGIRARVIATKKNTRDTLGLEILSLPDSNGQKHGLSESELTVFDFATYRKLRFDRCFYQVAATRLLPNDSVVPISTIPLTQLSVDLHLLGQSRSFEFKAQIDPLSPLLLPTSTPLPFELTPK